MLPAIYGESDISSGVIQIQVYVFQVFRSPVITALRNYISYGETAGQLTPLIYV